MTRDYTPERDDEHEMQTKALDHLSKGDEVLVNDRSRPITVAGRHQRKNSSRVWKQKGYGEHHTIIKLTGNGTTYHLLCTPGVPHGPMLYKETDWYDDAEDRLGQSPVYAGGGDRVESLEVQNVADPDTNTDEPEEERDGTCELKWAPEDGLFLWNHRGETEFGSEKTSVMHFENPEQVEEARDLLTDYLEGETVPEKYPEDHD